MDLFLNICNQVLGDFWFEQHQKIKTEKLVDCKASINYISAYILSQMLQKSQIPTYSYI